MATYRRAIAVLSSALAIAHSQFVTAPTDLTSTSGYLDIPVRYKQVPEGTCELTPGVKSYSGYVDVEEEQHIFWWFFEARNAEPTEAPLTVWINGGPGSSSVLPRKAPCALRWEGHDYMTTSIRRVGLFGI